MKHRTPDGLPALTERRRWLLRLGRGGGSLVLLLTAPQLARGAGIAHTVAFA